MIRSALAIVLAAGATSVYAAQPTDVPTHKCQPKPEYPGRLALQSDTRRKGFEREIKAYKDCIMGYIDERKVAIKANDAAANEAVEEYNALMKKINDEQKAAAQQ